MHQSILYLPIKPLALAAAVTLGCCALAPRADASGLLIADGGLGGVLEIKEQNVKVTVNNGIAVTTVDQVFHNTENRPVEALYTFPVPRGASVSNFSMWINGTEMVGEVVEKKRAREIYDSYKAVKRDPGLLEQVDYRTFEMRVFPIAAGADQHVQISYYQELDFDHDRATYVYPLATNTRPGLNSKTTGKFALSFDAKSEVPIKNLESTSHPKEFAVAKHAENYQQASLETKSGDLSRDVVLSFETPRPRTGLDMICSRPSGEDGYYSLSLTAGEELAAANKPMDYVFVLDISGSMNEDNKLDLSEKSLGAFVKALPADDRFDVITFNVQANTLFNQLMPADDAAKKKAAVFLAGQEAMGGTVLNRAMTAAYKYAQPGRALNVVVLSDGLTEQGERKQLAELIKQRPADARVFTIGVGNDVNRALLEQLADESGGLAAFISSSDNLERQAQAFRRKLMHPAVSGVAIKIDGVDAYDEQPAKLPNLYYGMPVRLYGRYKGSGPGRVTISGTIAGQPFTQTVDMDFPKTDNTNPEIERMWAWKKMDDLLKHADADASRQPVIGEIVRLGEAYSIASEYTSFLVLENDSEYQRWKIERRNATRIGRDREAQERVNVALEKLRENASADLGPAGAEKAPATLTTFSQPQPAASPAGVPQPHAATPRPETGRNRDLGTANGRAGGALDPVSATAVLGLAGAAWLTRKRLVRN